MSEALRINCSADYLGVPNLDPSFWHVSEIPIDEYLVLFNVAKALVTVQFQCSSHGAQRIDVKNPYEIVRLTDPNLGLPYHEVEGDNDNQHAVDSLPDTVDELFATLDKPDKDSKAIDITKIITTNYHVLPIVRENETFSYIARRKLNP